MSFKTKNNIFLAVLYIVISFAASMATTFAILWPYYHGISSGNRGVDLYIFICGSLLVFQTIVGTLRFIFAKDPGIDVPYLIYIWIIYITVCGTGILLAKLGVPIPEKEKTLYVMIGISIVLGVVGYIGIGLIQNKQNDKHFDKLKTEIKERKSKDTTIY